jgi:hypothetical protein
MLASVRPGRKAVRTFSVDRSHQFQSRKHGPSVFFRAGDKGDGCDIDIG